MSRLRRFARVFAKQAKKADDARAATLCRNITHEVLEVAQVLEARERGALH